MKNEKVENHKISYPVFFESITTCPMCGRLANVKEIKSYDPVVILYHCQSCGYVWEKILKGNHNALQD